MSYLKNVGFISVRFSGTDGVSLEAAKWAKVLTEKGLKCSWFAGELDRDPAQSFLVSEAQFDTDENLKLHRQFFGHSHISEQTTQTLLAKKTLLKKRISEFVEKFSIDLLIPQNILCLPVHLPLSLAVAEFIEETQIPTLAHHHDFWWERERFIPNCVQEYLDHSLPPQLPSVRHVVIHSKQAEDLKAKKNFDATVVPNVLDFETPPPASDEFSQSFRQELGLSSQDVLIIQPTRVVERKGIEHAIELTARLNDPCYKLIVTHAAGDEGLEYRDKLEKEAKTKNIDIRFIDERIGVGRNTNPEGEKIFSLEDAYLNANLVTYPSLYEGFGNALLEAIYFKLPVVVHRYPVFVKDIEPTGLDLITFDGSISDETVRQSQKVLKDQTERHKIVEHNFEICKKHYSYKKLKDLLYPIIQKMEK